MFRFFKRVLHYFMKDGYSYSVGEEVLIFLFLLNGKDGDEK